MELIVIYNNNDGGINFLWLEIKMTSCARPLYASSVRALPSIGGDASRSALPLAERAFPSERRVPRLEGAPCEMIGRGTARADLLLSPVLCACWSCETILDNAALRVRRSLVLQGSDRDRPHPTNTPPISDFSGLHRHASPYTFVHQICWRPHILGREPRIRTPSGGPKAPLLESCAKF